MNSEQTLIEKLHSETAKIGWHELQTYFAKGSLLVVDERLDLVAIAADFAEDNADKLKPKLAAQQIAPPEHEKVRSWYANNSEFWAVVVAPYVLVQPLTRSQAK